MVQIVQAKNLELFEVEERFNLQQVWDSEFFTEWQGELPEISDLEKQWLDQIKADFLSVVKHTLHEEVVKMFVLAPLLSLAGLARFPFIPLAEHQVEIEFEDEDEAIKGKIDLLGLHHRLWAIIVESKRQTLNVTTALPQALCYMVAGPSVNRPTYGLALNGTEFLFLKFVKGGASQYGISRLFSLLNPGNDLYTVLGIMKHLREAVLATSAGEG